MKIRSALVLVIMLFQITGFTFEKEKKSTVRTEEGVGLTIYSSPNATQNPYYDRYGRYITGPQGYAVVKEWRKIKLNKGTNEIRFQDVASSIDATTVYFKSLTDPDGTTVVEQNYEYDLVDANKILRKYIDKEITIESKAKGLIKGTLLSIDNGPMVLRVDNEKEPIQILYNYELLGIKLPNLPGGLITKPTLVWMLDAAKEGEHLVKVTYQASGISWNADYTAVISKDDKLVDLSGWVTINNQSGASYNESKLKLVAGDVNRVAQQGAVNYARDESFKASAGGADAGFVEKPFFEYHLYTLGRKTTLQNNSIKQIELFAPVEKVPLKKIFIYNGLRGYYYGGYTNEDQNFGATSNKKVDIYVEFENKKE
ncbi:MAG: hypothetical protein HY606_05860, partial [Planctomycetes bacterium]|nr:hypothetical protein [Planctomycetota bacterium]